MENNQDDFVSGVETQDDDLVSQPTSVETQDSDLVSQPASSRVNKKIIAIGIVVLALIIVILGGFFVFQKIEEASKKINGDLVQGNLEGDVTEVIYWQKDERYFYEVELLGAALENTVDEYGPYIVRPFEGEGVVEGDRGMKMLESGAVDISFNSVTAQREQRLLPIRVPLLGGLLGYRISLTRDIIEPALSKVETLDELSKFTAGFGAQWGDMAVLEANNINVKGFVEYNMIFEMLSAGQIDYFPRGVNEAWVEYEKFKDKYPNIRVEENIALHYPLLRYYFVNRENTKLAERIEKGLIIAKEDGTFKELFLKYYGDDIERANLENRKIFELENPTITDREIDSSWWLKSE